MACVEILLLGPQKANSAFFDAQTRPNAHFKELLATCSGVPACPLALIGPRHEDPAQFVVVMVWTSLAAGNEAASTSPVKEAIAAMQAGLKPPIERVLVNCQNDPLPALKAPATEFLSSYFPPSIPQTQLDSFNTALSEVLRLSNASSHGLIAESGGWVEGPVSHESFGESAEGKSGHRRIAIVGWRSVEAHLDFRTDEGMLQHIGLIRNKGQSSQQMFHVTWFH